MLDDERHDSEGVDGRNDDESDRQDLHEGRSQSRCDDPSTSTRLCVLQVANDATGATITSTPTVPDRLNRVDAADFPAILDAARGGDPDAVAALWRWMNPRLLRYLRVVAPGLEEDIASETWLAVARGLDGFTGDLDAFGGWIHTLSRNKMIDHRRRVSRRPTEVPLEATEPGSDARPEDELFRRLSLDDALAILAMLPRDQAEAITLRVVAGLSVDETARVMGRRPGSVRVLTHRGLRNLAARLAPSAETEV
jgi:RNA polymerase sigma-70 factor, ECF subfamily